MNLQKVQLTNGEEIAYRKRDGGKKVFLLIHGNMTSSKHWDILMDTLHPAYTVYAVDLRGFGGSSYRNRITSIKDFSDDVKAFVDEIGITDFAMMGWSLGGTVAMQFVADYPGLCNRLLLLASGSTRGFPVFEMRADGTFNYENRLQSLAAIEKDIRTISVQQLYDEKNRQGLKAVWNATIYTDQQPKEAQYKAYIDDMVTQRNLADTYDALNKFNISPVHNGVTAGTNEVAQITIPTCLLYGDRDYVVSEQMAQEIIKDMGDNLTFIRLKDTGHSPMIDDLKQVRTAIEDFLE